LSELLIVIGVEKVDGSGKRDVLRLEFRADHIATSMTNPILFGVNALLGEVILALE
jgi:hypothetical protein